MVSSQLRDEVADIVESAADLLERAGWIQDEDHIQGMGYCMVGALRQCLTEHYTRCEDQYPAPIWENVIGEVRAHMGTGTPAQIAAWNDEYGRTKQEVLDKLRSIAKEIRG